MSCDNVLLKDISHDIATHPNLRMIRQTLANFTYLCALPRRLGTRSIDVSESHRQVVPVPECPGVLISSSPRSQYCTVLQKAVLRYGASARVSSAEELHTPAGMRVRKLRYLAHLMEQDDQQCIIADDRRHPSGTTAHIPSCPHHDKVLCCPTLALG